MLLNYINSEIFRVKNRMYAKMFILINAVCMIGCIFLLKITAVQGVNFNFNLALGITPVFFTALQFLILIVVDIVFSEEYKHHTLKNPVAYGIERSSIYIGKLVVEIAYALVAFIAVMVVFLVAGYFILGADSSTLAECLKVFFMKAAAYIPLAIAVMSLANFLAFMFNSSNVFSLLYVGLIMAASKIVGLLAHFNANLVKLNVILPSTYLSQFQDEGIASGLIGKCYLLGAAYLIVFAIAGIILFKRREIK